MGRAAADRAADIVLARWPKLGPSMQGAALDLLLRRTSSTKRALDAMEAGDIAASGVSLDQRIRLLKNKDDGIRKLSEKLFGGAVSANRKAVAEKYEAALSMQASASNGLAVFKKICSKCHKVDGVGHVVGPDISDVRNRDRLALLHDILDPNRKVEPRFANYTIQTDDGRVFTGLMISESDQAVVLGLAEGKQQIVPRAEIEEIRSTGQSLMPEGVEKDVTIQQMADLLEFLKTRGRTSAPAETGD